MAKVVKKKKKRRGGGFGAGAAKIREESSLRPKFVEKLPPCMDKCPSGTDIRKVITTIAQTEDRGRTYEESYRLAWETIVDGNPFPAVCGRVCPHPCEDGCNRKELEGALSINAIERFLGDWAIEQGLKFDKLTDEKRKEKIAVIGAGPAGMSCAYHLARKGFNVTVFEAFSHPGGMLWYGIPQYRLPRDVIEKEVQRIADLGVKIKYNTIIGKDISLDELKEQYDAVFVGIGAHKGYNLGIEGEDAENVMTGTEFLNKINSGETVDVGKKVIVIGGGDSAIDAARVSKRLGADVTILYRRTIKEMPAIEHEVEEAQVEGIKIEFLAAPISFIKGNNNRAKGMVAQRMELGEPDSSGRRRPVPIQGSEFEIMADTVIAAISQEPDFEGLENLREGKDWVKVDQFGRTQDEKIFAGGDVTDLGLVTIAIYQGRCAAQAIQAYFDNDQPKQPVPKDKPIITADKMKLSHYEQMERNQIQGKDVDARFKDPWGEIYGGLTEEQLKSEAKRCMSCGLCFDCGNCWSFCSENAVIKPSERFGEYKFKLEFCNGCKKCAEECPCGYIEMF